MNAEFLSKIPTIQEFFKIDPCGELTEGTRSNVVLQIEGTLYTPPVKSGILNGIYRQHLLNTGKVKEKTLYKKDLLNAEKIFCINSVRGMVEVELWF